MRLVPPDGEEIEVRDEILAILGDSAAAREAILRRNRLWFDCPEGEFERAVAEIASGEDPQRRLDETEARRSSSAAAFYTNLHNKLAQHPVFKLPDLRPPDAEALVRHLRLRSGAGSGEAFQTALDAAADALIREEGLLAAIERLAGLPVPLPTPLIEAVASLSTLERCSLFRRLLRVPSSPPSKMHVIRLLSRFGEDTQSYFRLARRIGTRLFAAQEAEEFEAFTAVLKSLRG
jgi:hypothetical protein